MKVISKQEYNCIQYTNETFNEVVSSLRNYFGNEFSYTINNNNEMVIRSYGCRLYGLFLRINDYLIWGNGIIKTCGYEEFSKYWEESKGGKK